MVKGGHAFYAFSFFREIDALSRFHNECFRQAKATAQLVDDKAYPFVQSATSLLWPVLLAPEKAAYLQVMQYQKPFLFLPHALVLFSKKFDFEQFFAGKSLAEVKSIFKKFVLSQYHCVCAYGSSYNYFLAGSSFRKLPFFYNYNGNTSFSENVKPLLGNSLPLNTDCTAGENKFTEATIIYQQICRSWPICKWEDNQILRI